MDDAEILGRTYRASYAAKLKEQERVLSRLDDLTTALAPLAVQRQQLALAADELAMSLERLRQLAARDGVDLEGP